MPRFDGTGPFGAGPGTGRGLGPCGAGRRFGRGMGFRRGWGYTPYRITKKEEINMLNDEEEMLKEEAKAIKERLAELRGKN